MKKIVWLFPLLLAAPLFAQTDAFSGYCNRGGQSVSVSGLNSTNKFQNVIPHCTVSVYFTGTTTLVPGNQIFSNALSTVLGNPFTADALTSLTPGKWLFYADDGQGYDVIGSGGDAPNTYPSPVPLCVDCIVKSGGGSGGPTITTTSPIRVNGANGPVSSSTALLSCDLATNTTTGCLRPDGTICTVSGGIFTCASSIGPGTPLFLPIWLTTTTIGDSEWSQSSDGTTTTFHGSGGIQAVSSTCRLSLPLQVSS